jgi:hypothetical protein
VGRQSVQLLKYTLLAQSGYTQRSVRHIIKSGSKRQPPKQCTAADPGSICWLCCMCAGTALPEMSRASLQTTLHPEGETTGAAC